MGNTKKLADALRAFMAKHGDVNCVDDEHCNARAALAELDTQQEGFTIFLREDDGTGTTHVTHQETATVEEAITAAKAECCEAWGYDPDAPLHVLGVAAGDVTIVDWDDLL